MMVKGYQDESEKQATKLKGYEKELKMLQEQLSGEKKLVKELQQKALLGQDKVFVEKAKEELDIDTVNLMGTNAISQKNLQDLHQQVQRLQLDKMDLERDLSLKDGQLKSQINKLREEKAATEK